MAREAADSAASRSTRTPSATGPTGWSWRPTARSLQGQNDRRFRIEHAQVVAPEDFALFAKYSVIAAMQATHATSDMRWAETRLGPERVKGAYAWQRFLALGVPVANGSDFPVEEPNPLRGFYAAITRQDQSRQSQGRLVSRSAHEPRRKRSEAGPWRGRTRRSRRRARDRWRRASWPIS